MAWDFDIRNDLTASVIWDFAKGIAKWGSKKEMVQVALRQLDIQIGAPNNFKEKYVESLVEMRFQDYGKEVLDFCREELVREALYMFYYGDSADLGNEKSYEDRISRCVAGLRVGEELTEKHIDPKQIIQQFRQVFEKIVRESQTIAEAEQNLHLLNIKKTVENIDEKLSLNPQKAISKYLTPLPFDPPVFIGRDDELKTVHDKLFAGENFLMLVNGQGGMGKTSFASKYWKTYEDKYHHLAYILIENGIANALLSIAGALKLELENQMPVEERLEKLLHAISKLEKPCLLLLDNANDYEDLEREMVHLRKCSNCHLLVTSRLTEISGVFPYLINELPGTFPLELFKTYYTKHNSTEDKLFDAIFKAVGGNTLVVEVLAKNLREINQNEVFYPLSALLHDLQTKGLLQLTEQAHVKANWGSFEKIKPETIISAMYDLHPLDKASLQILSNFAVLPPENISYSTLKTLLAPENPRTFSDTLTALWRKGWIEKSENNGEAHYKCSPVVQEIVKNKNASLQADCDVLVSNLINVLKRDTLHIDNYSHSSGYVRLATSVIGSLANPHDNLATLCQNIGNYHTDTGNLGMALFAFEKMEYIQQRLVASAMDNPDYKNGLAISYAKLGSTHSTLGNLDKALTFFEKCIELIKELYEAFPQNISFKNGLAISYEKLGDTHSALGNLDKALTFFEKYLELTKELYEAFPQNVSFKNGLAISYSKLGDTHSALDNLDKALTFFEKDIELTKELYEAFPQNVNFKNGLAISYEKLGETHSALGNLDKALMFFEDENILVKELYEAFPQNVSFKNGLAISYSKLGDTHSVLGNLDKALTYFEERARVGKELYEAFPQNVSFKNGLAISYYKLGRFYCDHRMNKTEAKKYFQQAETLWKELVRDAPQYSNFKKFLGIVQKDLSEME